MVIIERVVRPFSSNCHPMCRRIGDLDLWYCLYLPRSSATTASAYFNQRLGRGRVKKMSWRVKKKTKCTKKPWVSSQLYWRIGNVCNFKYTLASVLAGPRATNACAGAVTLRDRCTRKVSSAFPIRIKSTPIVHLDFALNPEIPVFVQRTRRIKNGENSLKMTTGAKKRGNVFIPMCSIIDELLKVGLFLYHNVPSMQILRNVSNWKCRTCNRIFLEMHERSL